MTRKTTGKKNKKQRQNPEINLYLKSKTNLWIKENPRRGKSRGPHIHGNWSIYMSNSCQSNRKVEGSMLASMETGSGWRCGGNPHLIFYVQTWLKGPFSCFYSLNCRFRHVRSVSQTPFHMSLSLKARGIWLSNSTCFLCTFGFLRKLAVLSWEKKELRQNALGTLSKIHLLCFFYSTS